jgi:hypothetical protein
MMMMEKETLYHQKQMVISFFLFLLLNRHTKELKKKLSLAKNKNVLGESDVSTAAA